MEIEELYQIYKECRSISTDTRKLVPGSMFFALKGDNFDGNQFALDALKKGCSYAVVDDPGVVHAKYARHLKYVPDAIQSLQSLAAYHRSQLKVPFIGITGSNGKTTTKELLSAVLSRKYKVCATHGNLNNHIGVPLTILSVFDHEIAIIEMGANHIGEIAALCKIADPTFGIITNIGKAHLEGFGSVEGVARAKSELFDHLARRNAKAFVDSDNPLLLKLAKDRMLKTVCYGGGPASVCTGEIMDNNTFLNASIHLKGSSEKLDVRSSLIGSYNLSNLLAAACIGNYFGVNPAQIGSALNEYVPSNSRSQLVKTLKNKIVLDAYNANPSSMAGSIKNFLSLKEDLPKMLILGDMLELGKYSNREHLAIIELLKEEKVTNILLVGPEFFAVSGKSSISSFKKVEDLINYLNLHPVIDHLILLKGSRGIKLEKLIEVL